MFTENEFAFIFFIVIISLEQLKTQHWMIICPNTLLVSDNQIAVGAGINMCVVGMKQQVFNNCDWSGTMLVTHNVDPKLATWQGTGYKFSSNLGLRTSDRKGWGRERITPLCRRAISYVYLLHTFWQVIYKAGWLPSLKEALTCQSQKLINNQLGREQEEGTKEENIRMKQW